MRLTDGGGGGADPFVGVPLDVVADFVEGPAGFDLLDRGRDEGMRRRDIADHGRPERHK